MLKIIIRIAKTEFLFIAQSISETKDRLTVMGKYIFFGLSAMCMLFLPGYASCQSARAYGNRTEAGEWQRLVQGFRSGHHFGLGMRIDRMDWSGAILFNDEWRNFDSEKDVMFARAFYAFYLPLDWGIGYYLGTSMQVPLIDLNRESNLDLGYIDLPGIIAGVSLEFDPRYRMTLGAEANLRRFLEFELNEEINAVFTARSWGIVLSLDYFYDFENAVRIELARNRLTQNSNDSIDLLGKGYSIAVTWLQHLI